MDENRLYYGDNLDVLRAKVSAESVDLCYIDPPFNSKRNYNQIYNNIGGEDRAQAQAFIDTWSWNSHAEECFEQIMLNVNNVQTRQSIELIQGLSKVLGKSSLFAYLVSMEVRIAEIHRTLKSTGSFYLHCDPTASHYLKVICDALFVPHGGDYQNEIVWKRTSAHSSAKRWGPNHDVLLFYTKSANFAWNRTFQKYNEEYVKDFYKHFEGERRYQLVDLTAPEIRMGDSGKAWKNVNPTEMGRHWAVPNELLLKYCNDLSSLSTQDKLDVLEKNNLIYWTKNRKPRLKRFLDSSVGVPIQDFVEDIRPISSQAAERLGYPTQKPESLLQRIIAASSNESDVVLDAFCGCGTTTAVAALLKRRWIGIDITYQSISLVLKRLEDAHGKAILDTISIDGIPKDVAAVEALIHKKDDRLRKEFEKWAILTYSNNRAVINEKKGADKGIDGTAFMAISRDEVRPVMLSAKSGKVKVEFMRDLRGVIERENSPCGILITHESPTKPMLQEAREAGIYRGEFGEFERLQIVTTKQILEGRRINLPVISDVLKTAVRGKTTSTQKSLFG